MKNIKRQESKDKGGYSNTLQKLSPEQEAAVISLVKAYDFLAQSYSRQITVIDRDINLQPVNKFLSENRKMISVKLIGKKGACTLTDEVFLDAIHQYLSYQFIEPYKGQKPGRKRGLMGVAVQTFPQHFERLLQLGLKPATIYGLLHDTDKAVNSPTEKKTFLNLLSKAFPKSPSK